jgi:hypothetical protein
VPPTWMRLVMYAGMLVGAAAMAVLKIWA